MKFRVLVVLIALVLIGVLVPGASSVQPLPVTGQVEPRAGTWKTWVLSSSRQLRGAPSA